RNTGRRAGGMSGPLVRFASAIDDLADLFRGLSDLLGRLLIRIVRSRAEPSRLLRQLVAQVRSGLRSEQHPQPRAEHRACQQPHQKRAASIFAFQTIVFVSHETSCALLSDGGYSVVCPTDS